VTRPSLLRSNAEDEEIIRHGGLPFTPEGIGSHADWANVRAAKARIKARKRWSFVAGVAFWLAVLALWWHAGFPTGGSGNHENCWTDPKTGQIVQCEGDGRN
jgi:hypothetical protein